MRNCYTITITDVHGSRQYTLTHLFKRFLLLFGAALTVVILVGGGVLWQLLSERSNLEMQIEDLYQQKAQVESEFQEALAKQNELYTELFNDKQALESQVQEKEGKLSFLEETIDKFEESLGLKQPDGAPETTQTLTGLSKLDQQLLLNRIPSGLPTEYKVISDGFGWRTHPVTKKRTFHDGLDFSADVGTSVQATADGVVEFVGYDGGYGQKIVINHGYGFRTVYGHLSKYKVSKGQVVGKGDEIALSGNTGLSSGPHLHYEVHYLGNKLNPRFFADWGMRRFDQIAKQVREVPWASFAELVSQERQLVLRLSLPTDAPSSVN